MTTTGKVDLEHVDLPNLAEQLKGDGVAFDDPDLATNSKLNDMIAGALADGDGIAVIDHGDNSVGWSRDVAQKLLDRTGLDTVLVQRPRGVSAVSDTLSRAEIEAAQAHVRPGESQVAALRDFYDALGDPGLTPPWVVLFPLAVLACLLVGWGAWRAAVR